ncbi:MAG: type I-E CRISPR-associated protein Cas5/CasD [Deltaproteobacteria bacterium]|nr:type I-E CRISPR-associated protein Cas5/CasD [Deltaproteobacteria bacterium]
MSERGLCALSLVFEGPMQSYGASAVGKDRPTEDAPTKSAVLGLLGAALGIARDDVQALVALDRAFDLVVRVDRPGDLLDDYHTSLDVPWIDGGGIYRHAEITRRRYLCGARFTLWLVSTAASEQLLATWHDALRYPRYAPVLGRRGCPPGAPTVGPVFALVRAATWRELVGTVALDDASLRDASFRRDTTWAVHVDESLCSGEDVRGHRKLIRRDRLVGPGKRMFYDRTVRVFAWSPSEASRDARSDSPGRDTTEGYFDA